MPPLLEISGKNIRNIKEYSIEPSPQTNIFIGRNGAGKTNYLEAIYLNTLGRSFRTSITRNLICDNEKACWVFAKHQNNQGEVVKIGVERKKGYQQEVSINGKRYPSLAELAVHAPTIAIQPTETQLIDGTSQHRRKYLDWVLFHVEPQFLTCWRHNQKLLKQRNQLLRRISSQRRMLPADTIELRAWDQRYIQSCQELSEYRHEISDALKSKTLGVINELPAFNDKNTLDIGMEYYKGWARGKELSEELAAHLEQDIKRGFSGLGAHRCDILIQEGNRLAKDHLSRGQKKLLSMSMCLAQAMVLKSMANKQTIMLLDDIFSEIDEENTRSFVAEIEKIDAQIFLSCLHTQRWVKNMFSKETKLFHVEHGQIKQEI